MLRDLVCTALCCFECKTSHLDPLYGCYGLLCAAINVGESGLECCELVRMFGYLVWTALGLSQQFITSCLKILQTYLSPKPYKLQPFS